MAYEEKTFPEDEILASKILTLGSIKLNAMYKNLNSKIEFSKEWTKEMDGKRCIKR